MRKRLRHHRGRDALRRLARGSLVVVALFLFGSLRQRAERPASSQAAAERRRSERQASAACRGRRLGLVRVVVLNLEIANLASVVVHLFVITAQERLAQHALHVAADVNLIDAWFDEDDGREVRVRAAESQKLVELVGENAALVLRAAERDVEARHRLLVVVVVVVALDDVFFLVARFLEREPLEDPRISRVHKRAAKTEPLGALAEDSFPLREHDVSDAGAALGQRRAYQAKRGVPGPAPVDRRAKRPAAAGFVEILRAQLLRRCGARGGHAIGRKRQAVAPLLYSRQSQFDEVAILEERKILRVDLV
mmetsp:Transcript_30007/g.92799  ORF Transcript_30007/g.92799 Transcript_30007/m.92799 type:complete len:309 (+) Transcript_30007:1345-2271(+)